LLKVAMLATANDLGTDGPDFIHGWGKVNALRAAKVLEENRYFSATVAQGDSNTHTINIPAGVQRAKIMVYWADKEGSTSSSIALVNDLDATVTDASSTVHYPWILDHTPNATTLANPATKGPDHLNNIEEVAIDNPTAGAFTLKVKGNAVPFGPQEYWVVYEYLYDDITVTFPTGGEGLIPGATDRIHWDAYGTTGNFTIEYSSDGGSSWTNVGTAAGADRFTNWTVPTNITGQGRIRITRGTASDMSDVNFSIIERPQNIRVNRVCPSVSAIQLAWDSVPGATGYDVYMLGQKYMDSIGSTTNFQYNVTVPNVNDPQWFSVRATGPNGIVGLRQIAVEYPGAAGGQGVCYLSCVADNDAGVDSVASPQPLVEKCGGATTVPVSVRLENIGLFTESNFPVSYQLGSGSVVTETFTNNINSGGNATYTFSTPLTLPATGVYELKIWTGLSTDSTRCNDTIVQTLNVMDPLAAFPYAEDFESGLFPPSDATVINNDNDDTWEITGVTGIDGNATTTMYVNNFNYNANGSEDIFQIVTMDLTAGNSALLKFDVAYRQYNGTFSDDLRLDISTDCGQTYSQLYFKDGATLATGAATTQAFSPNSANDWRSDTVDLTSYIGNEVTIRFVNIGGWGNNLYVDNINVDVSGLAPVADFTSNVTTSCDGIVNFEDMSGNGPTQWLWSFGDGGVSTQQNPTHTYNASGTYNVSLQVTNGLGNDTETKSAFVVVEFPNVTSTVGDEGCPNTSLSLMATNGSGDLHWYDAGSLVHVGDTFNTPPLANTTAYQVKDVIERPIVKAGPPDNTFGGGGYHGSGFTGAVNFTADTSFTIVSAWVDAQGAGDRVVYLWDGNIANGGGTITNTVLQQVTVTLANGPQRVTLNLDVPGAGDYALGGSQMDLYRNNSGPTYPYVVPNVVSLTSSTANNALDFYYYFYDLELRLMPCESSEQTVTASIVDADFTMNVTGNSVAFTDNSTGATSWMWDFGDGNTSTQQNPMHTYNSNGPHTVTLTINNGACSYADTLSAGVGIEEISDDMNLVIMPNPTDDRTTLRFSQALPSDLQVEVLSVDGRLLQQTVMPMGAEQISLDLSDYPSAVYLIRMRTDEVVDIRKVVKRD